MPEWTLLPGQQIKRTTLHQRYGGQRQSGISPSRKSPNIFIFSDPSSGERHGYYDGWKDTYFHYTGEGQRGNQRMVAGNRAILQAAQDRRVIRVFNGVGGKVEYRGRFALAPKRSWYPARVHATANGRKRSVIVFRLRPLDSVSEAPPELPAVKSQTRVKDVPIESRFAEKTWVSARKIHEALRRESALLQEFQSWMKRKGCAVTRRMIKPANEANAIYTDLFIKRMNTLVEAKGNVDRASVRMAIGQLLDYRRFYRPVPQCAVLLPSRPPEDLRKLIAHVGMHVYYRVKGRFVLQNGKGGRVRLPSVK